jgi:bacterioferritin (cytochrome b1)
LEYTAAVQYNQHSMLLTGRDRLLFEDLFEDSAKQSLEHAKMWGERIVYLGGVPAAKLGAIRQSTKLEELLEMGLEIERKAVDVYTRAHRVCKQEATRYMLEDMIVDEDKDVEKFMKLLGKVRIAQMVLPEKQAVNQ